MSIAIVGMLDEREEVIRIIKDRIEGKGLKTCLMDISIGTGAGVPSLRPDVTAREMTESVERKDAMAGAGNNGEANTAIYCMGEGLRKKVVALHQSRELDGIIAIGGMTSTIISLQALKALPFGFPKVLVSSAAAMPAHASQLAEYFALKDITVMHAVVDTVGMNRLVEALAMNGANAVAGMVQGLQPVLAASRPSLAITEFGFCDKGAHHIRRLLETDHEIVSFHSTGLGDMAAMELVNQGYFSAFVDLVPGTYSEYLFGGNRASRADRLDIAADRPIPYIFCPGGFDMISCGPIERRHKEDELWTSRKLANRQLHIQDPLRVQARTSMDEMVQLGGAVAERLNLYRDKARVKVMIPLGGFSSLSVKGGPLFDPEADRAFTVALQAELSSEISITELDTDINSPEFAQAVAETLQGIPEGSISKS